MELQELEIQLNNIAKKIASLVKSYALKLPFQLQMLISYQMQNEKPDNAWINAKPYSNTESYSDETATFNETNKLRIKTGKYLQSFLPKKPYSLTKVNYDSSGYNVTIGSALPYLHETADDSTKIYAKKLTSRNTYAMTGFFWYKYFKSRNEMFKIIALSVQKKGYVKVKSRKHLRPAFESFDTAEYSKLLEKYLKEIIDLASDK